MLNGIDPLLTGEILWALDSMGHGDAVLISDAHFPAPRGGQRLVAVPGIGAAALVRAICSLLPLDDRAPYDLMESPESASVVRQELGDATGVALSLAATLDRQEFYAQARSATLVIRSGETRPFGNVILRKGIVESV